MILRELCNVARREGLLSNPDYEPKPVAWVITVADGGKLVNVTPTAGESEGKKSRAKVLDIPRRCGRRSDDSADFLVDKSEYVLGVEPDAKRSPEKLALRLKLFRDSIRKVREAIQGPALAAVEGFLESDTERLLAVREIEGHGYKSNDLFAFEYGGGLVHEFPAVQEYFSKSRRETGKEGVQCLICGRVAVPVDKHPAVKVPGGTMSGVTLVSFNTDAFESYGLARNANAPICRDCADGYTTALNRLFSARYPDPRRPGETLPRRFVRLSPDTTALFWADEASEMIDWFADFFEAPRAEAVAALFESPQKGRATVVQPGRFFCLLLSGGQGRAVLRGMHTGTVAEVEGNVCHYFRSTDVGSTQPLPLSALLRSLVLQGELKHLPPGLAAEVFLAIVFGRPFPQTLLARAVGRGKAERQVTRERAAILRAYVIRNLKLEVSVGLDRDNSSPGYRLGRLMAVLERIQGAAQRSLNKTIVDRYYSGASTRPATVFPRLVALAQHHLAKLPGGSETFYQRRLGEVVEGIASFPPTLGLEQQGLFALGYYHQRQEFYKKSEVDESEKGETE